MMIIRIGDTVIIKRAKIHFFLNPCHDRNGTIRTAGKIHMFLAPHAQNSAVAQQTAGKTRKTHGRHHLPANQLTGMPIF